MKKVRIVIVDDCPVVCKALNEKLSVIPEFEIVQTIRDPMLAEKEIRRLKPDILLQDVVMPSIDGDDILESLKGTLDYNMGIIVLSPITNDMTISYYSGLGAHYFISKPVNYDKLIKKIKLLHASLNCEDTSQLEQSNDYSASALQQEASGKQLAAKITRLLLRMGVNPKLKGFYFLKEGIYFMCLPGNELSSVTKIVYPRIAKDFGTEAEKVERAIRTAIEKAFVSEEDIKYYYEVLASYRGRKTSRLYPSNREFIFTVAEYIKNGDSIDLIS